MDKKVSKHTTAKLRNEVALYGTIGLQTAKELCLFLALIGQVNPYNEDEKMEGLISFKDIVKLVQEDTGKRSGSRYERVVEFLDRMKKGNYIDFPSDVLFDGKSMPKTIYIFDTLEPIEIPAGNRMYKFSFNESIRPYIMGLKEKFVQLKIPSGMKSGHAVRFFMMAKAYHDRLRAHYKITKMRIEVDEIKRIFGIKGKYKSFDNFRRRIIETVVSEINDSGLLYIKSYDFIRTGRKITEIEFHFQDGELLISPQEETTLTLDAVETDASSAKDYVPSEQDIAKLSRAELAAYHFLIERQCKAGIVYRRILPHIPSSEFKGWEDIYIEKAWGRFEQVTKYKQAKRKAGAFVKWWGAGEFKDRLFSELMEKVIADKKTKSPDQYANRQVAKDMTAAQFVAWYKAQKETKEVITETLASFEITPKSKHSKKDINIDEWKQANPKKYAEIVAEQHSRFEVLLGEMGANLDASKKEYIRKNMIESAVEGYFRSGESK